MAAVVPPPLRLVKALYKNKTLTLAEANEVTKVDAANVNTVAGGNKVACAPPLQGSLMTSGR